MVQSLCAENVFLQSDAAATIRGSHFFSWKTHRYQRQLIKVHTSDTVMTVRNCQQQAQPLSPAVSRGNKLHNTNSPVVSLVNVIRNYSHTCVCTAYSSRSYYSRVALICSELLIVRLLFEGGVYLIVAKTEVTKLHMQLFTCQAATMATKQLVALKVLLAQRERVH